MRRWVQIAVVGLLRVAGTHLSPGLVRAGRAESGASCRRHRHDTEREACREPTRGQRRYSNTACTCVARASRRHPPSPLSPHAGGRPQHLPDFPSRYLPGRRGQAAVLRTMPVGTGRAACSTISAPVLRSEPWALTVGTADSIIASAGPRVANRTQWSIEATDEPGPLARSSVPRGDGAVTGRRR